jgi:hypothetical protein
LERLRGKLLASAIEELASANHQSACSQLWENHIKITVAADIQSMDLQPQSLSVVFSKIIESVGSTRSAMVLALGIISCSNSNRFGATSVAI